MRVLQSRQGQQAEDKDNATVHGAELVQAKAHREDKSGSLLERHACGSYVQSSKSRRKLL